MKPAVSPFVRQWQTVPDVDILSPFILSDNGFCFSLTNALSVSTIGLLGISSIPIPTPINSNLIPFVFVCLGSLLNDQSPSEIP